MRLLKVILFILLNLIVFSTLLFAEIPAFPTAEGGGKYTVGGRGGIVYEVTNLNASGPGSLREGCENVVGPRTIVFRVGGTIDLGGNDIIVTNPYITIAGQTAPGDGIQIKNGGIVFHTDQIIVRYLRVRRGPNGTADSITVKGASTSSESHNHHAIFDHLSLYWGTDETFDAYGFDNLTIQNSIVAEGLHKSTYTEVESFAPYYTAPDGTEYREHSRGLMITYHSKEITLYRNLIYNNFKRNPLIQSSNADVVNNVIVNRETQLYIKPLKEAVHANIVGNYFRTFYHAHRPVVVFDMDQGYDGNTDVYYFDNFDSYYRPDNSYSENAIREFNTGSDSDGHPSDRTTPYPVLNSVTAEPVQTAYLKVLNEVGCYIEGRLNRDSADDRVVTFVSSGNAPSKYVDGPPAGYTGDYNDFGGWPVINGGVAPTDTDHDGMPDSWENAHGLDPNDASDRNETNLSAIGYTNLEVYLNEITNVNHDYTNIDADKDGVINTYDLDSDNDGIPDDDEKQCGTILTGNWSETAPGSGIWESQTGSVGVRLILEGQYNDFWGSGYVGTQNMDNTCTSFTSRETITNHPAMKLSAAGADNLNNANITFQFFDLNTGSPVSVKKPVIHFGRFAGQSSNKRDTSKWLLQGGLTQTLLSGCVHFTTTPTQIYPDDVGTNISGGTYNCASGELSGSVRINADVSSFTYNVVQINNEGNPDGVNSIDNLQIIVEACSPLDTDNDGVPNYLDLDSDGDGISDILEAGGVDNDNDSHVDYVIPGDASTMIDADKDGLDDSLDNINNGSVAGEVTTGTPLANPDTDGDGIKNVIDIDSDNDGIVDNIEGQATATYQAPSENDVDGDGLDDRYDQDNETVEGIDGGTGTVIIPVNTDGIDSPDYIDSDSDNDGDNDALEGWDTNNNGVANTIPANADADKDGLDDNYDNDDNRINPTNNQTPNSFPDIDEPGGDRDWRQSGHAPVALNDSVTTNENTPVTIQVLNNDTDVDSDDLNVTSIGAPAHGSAILNTNKTITYTPNTNYNGTDTFTYTINDGHGGTDTATVTVTINSVNNTPVAIDDNAITNEDTPVNISVISNDTDADNDTLTVTIMVNPVHGNATVNANKTIAYSPETNYNGTDTFTYTINDGHGGTDTATVSVTINPVNDAPVAVNDSATTNENTPVNISVLSNDTDADNDTLTVTITTSPSHGSATVNANKTIAYSPGTNYNGTDTFTYTINDGHGGTDTATVTVTVNQNPGISADSDNDGIPDSVEGNGDRDGDGIPDYQDYDPQGYFYDEDTGKIIPGGHITVTGPGAVNLIADGSTGSFQWTVTVPGTYTMAVTPPINYEISSTCINLDPPAYDPTGHSDPDNLGNGENDSTGYLTSNACTPYYLTFNLEAGDPIIINNNIPLKFKKITNVPTLSEWGIITTFVIMLLIGLYYRRKEN